METLLNLGIILVTITLNFIGAVLLKRELHNSFYVYKWLKYIMIIPPFSIVLWVVALIFGVIRLAIDEIKDYFKD